LARVDETTRERAIKSVATSPHSLDEAVLHLRAVHSLIRAHAPLTAAAPLASSTPPVDAPTSRRLQQTSTWEPQSLAGETEPQSGEAVNPTAEGDRWGETLILPWSQYRELHLKGAVLEVFTLWWLSSVFRPISDRTFNYARLHGPVAFIRRLAQTPLNVDGAKSTSPWNAAWTWVGVFFGIGCIAILHQYYTSPRFDWPVLFASHGALATLIFVTPGNNAVQPYHTFMGTLVSSFYAVVIQQNMDTTELLWLAVALSASASITTMQLLGCNHPPGGALSVLYIAVPTLQVLGYWYILAAEVGALIMTLVAVIVNNLPRIEGRRYPTGWFG
jgi:hypothetical protein